MTQARILHTLVIGREYYIIDKGTVAPIIWMATDCQLDILRAGNLFMHYEDARIELAEDRPMRKMLNDVGVTLESAA